MHVPLTPLDFLDRADRLFPDRVGVVEGERRWTYRQYAERCHRLAHFKVPGHVAFVDALPTGGTGKVQKSVLRERG